MFFLFYILSEDKNMQLILRSISKSFIGLANIGIVNLFVWITFGFVGIQLFKGKFGYCELPESVGINKEKCLQNGKSWIIHQNNFEDIFNALLTLYIVSTYDHLGVIVNVAINSNDENIVYFIILILIYINNFLRVQQERIICIFLICIFIYLLYSGQYFF